ncbi:peptidase, M50 family [Pelagibacterium halotolerans]|uniref:Peptidase, M50 family n=1 Tax=Pelagibacterium halotolerans (strain DSM 22347 / JCM 15775 / CGMCC 1.7692 / B2) TaxID=1082931 RepID=G4R9H7_PELHB|nr:peptidase, M50 family [Pelagibacterium halotolerans]AEQ50397.1 peptidase, M50 family [Pelagibacterium halotolerans B2]QJR19628.1 hypothetical protein HKM20_15015 [Pelagibacterium halotolerans]SDZ86238.1 hypothetical protein SAMN05428936_101288 [Pelagibacterium halotolerans]
MTDKLWGQNVNFLPDLSFQRLLYQFCAAVVVLTAHGYCLALGARLLGDRGPQYDGRLTLNPFSHAEPVGALLMIATQLGWARPVALDRDALWGNRIGPLLVSIGALVASLVLGWCCWQLRPVVFSALGGGTAGITIIGLLETTARSFLAFVIINLVPILPLSAGHFWLGVAPNLAAVLNRNRLVISIVLALICLMGAGTFVRGLVLVFPYFA